MILGDLDLLKIMMTTRIKKKASGRLYLKYLSRLRELTAVGFGIRILIAGGHCRRVLHGTRFGRLPRRFFRIARCRQVVIIVQGELHPGGAVGGSGWSGFIVFAEEIQVAMGLTGENRKALFGNRDVVLFDDALDFSKVPGSLGFVNVGNGDKAYIETLAGLLQGSVYRAAQSLPL